MNIYKQMQAQAEQIIPGVNLAELLRATNGENRNPKERRRIAALLRSGSYYLSPSWLAGYYPVTDSALVNIKNDFKIKTA